jgi:ribonucleotide reductase beta subunit family protein with ferritin-like domain
MAYDASVRYIYLGAALAHELVHVYYHRVLQQDSYGISGILEERYGRHVANSVLQKYGVPPAWPTTVRSMSSEKLYWPLFQQAVQQEGFHFGF